MRSTEIGPFAVHVRSEIAREIAVDGCVHRVLAFQAVGQIVAARGERALRRIGVGRIRRVGGDVARHQREPCDALGVHAKERERNVAADRMSGQCGTLDVKRIEQAGDVAGQHLHERRPVAGLRLAAPAQIDANHAYTVQRRQLLVPHAAIERKPVQQHQGRALAAGIVVPDPAAIDGHRHASTKSRFP